VGTLIDSSVLIAAERRKLEVMMTMQKIDVATIETARRG
jgi:predicted 3-demethylubiquinone-9 3-methyltransferase (glyoxalase superfamily)